MSSLLPPPVPAPPRSWRDSVRRFGRRLLDPQLGGQLRAVLRAVGAFGTLGALAVHADKVVGVVTAAQVLLSALVLLPTPPLDPPAPVFRVTAPPRVISVEREGTPPR